MSEEEFVMPEHVRWVSETYALPPDVSIQLFPSQDCICGAEVVADDRRDADGVVYYRGQCAICRRTLFWQDPPHSFTMDA